MAQTEDTELRDLVIEALERNGSLAKIRALLRANIFLAFEDECGNLKQNASLDKIIKLPEGTLALSLVHEFLEFCCLKNTLFVYMSESRQGNEYNYDGKKVIADKLNLPKCDNLKEPLLLTLLKNAKPEQKKYFSKNSMQKDNEEQNCTYILHEDSQSSTTSNSQSDNSSDEKNKLHLRLHLDNSDTDTSSDSARDKTSSEYVPGDHILDMQSKSCRNNNIVSQKNSAVNQRHHNLLLQDQSAHDASSFLNELKMTTISSSDSTSYIDIKPFNSLDEKMLNTAGLPVVDKDIKDQPSIKSHSVMNNKNDKVSVKSSTISNVTPISYVKENGSKSELNENKTQESAKSDADTAEFSYGDDFSSSPSKNKETSEKHGKSSESGNDDMDKSPYKNSPAESPHQISQSSQSSVSISDVADLISEKSSITHTNNKSIHSRSNHSKEKYDSKPSKLYSDDSGEFTDSPVPSISNLSLDIHSD